MFCVLVSLSGMELEMGLDLRGSGSTCTEAAHGRVEIMQAGNW